jgi:hypothetical protein
MPTNPADVYEAYTLLMTRLIPMQPHHIKYEADEADWRERMAHLQRLGDALDKYVRELGKDMAAHAHCSFDLKPFTDPISNSLDDALGAMERGAEAARLHNTLWAE